MNDTTDTDAAAVASDGTALNLWKYNPTDAAWEIIDSGTRTALTAAARRHAETAANLEEYRAAWVITTTSEIPPAILTLDDPDVFTPFPHLTATPPPGSMWSPLAGMTRPAARPALPPEPPVGAVIAWVTDQGYPLTAIRVVHAGWAVSGREDDQSWAELVDELTGSGIGWDRVGLVDRWTKLTDAYPVSSW